MKALKTKSQVAAIMRIICSLIAIVGCLFLIFNSLKFGISRAVGRLGVSDLALPAVTEAVRLTPSDPDAHRARATVFRELRMYRQAEEELASAVSLRPRDDYLWLELGSIRDQQNDPEAALTAFDQAVAKAPYYAHTRWQRANLRLRMGRYDEAFPELREAATSNRAYLSTLIDLAWSLSKQDAKLTEQLAGIESAGERISFARFLAKRGRGKETIEQYGLIKNQISPELKRELIRELMANYAYLEAFQIWSNSDSGVEKTSQIYDGGLEGSISFGEVGFGWSVGRQPRIDVSQDAAEKETGGKSLRIDFTGDSPSAQPIVSQIIIVKPEHKYRVSFASKTKDIVTGSAPVLLLTDAKSQANLAVSNLQLPPGVWHKLNVEFTTPANCFAVLMKVARNECQSALCPIFGTLWLDSFSIEEIRP